ncbi:MAG: hypothetical protein VKL39_01625 [Leptolyngbyaceae bacterium]|nr:hypothetical protein [Leptolyngbyaceae bacterium]
MNNRIMAIAIALITTFSLPAQAQTVEELREEVQRSVCQSDWDSALSTVGRLIGSSDISPDYRESLLQYRRQIQAWRASNTMIDATGTECQSYQIDEQAEAQAEGTESPEPAFIQSSGLNWDRAVSGNAATEPTCDPSYPDFCLRVNIEDLDCADVPYRRFRVLSPDPHNFDGDSDGVGCEW